MDIKVIKRDGKIVEFDAQKIYEAIMRSMSFGSGIIREDVARQISKEIEAECENRLDNITIREIENAVYSKLIQKGQILTAKAYEGYRAIQEFKRTSNTTDDGIIGLLKGTNHLVAMDNSNKNSILNSTMRDLIAGEVSKDITQRILLPTAVVQAHQNGILHFHDMDYSMSPMFNCCLINIQDMLDNGTVINGTLIESPSCFQTACNIMTQIMAQVASNQYGGQSVDIKHLGKYLRRTKNKAYQHYKQKGYSENLCCELAEDKMLTELKSGVQTIQYQINTLQTSNGQAPFVTIFMHIQDGFEYEEEVALIVKEILKQRLQGVKNRQGVAVTPPFPKLIYVLDENNCLNGGKYDYITREYAIPCSAKRMYPDYISAKQMRKIYDGHVFSCMGCRSFLSPWYDENGNVKFEGRFNAGVVSINLPQVAIIANGDEDKFWKLLDRRLDLCKKALLCRHEMLKGTKAAVSPIHWQDGAIARLEPDQTIDSLLTGGYCTLSLGYIGIYEMTKLMTGQSHTLDKGKDFAIAVMKHLKQVTQDWKKETGLGFALYGTPAESLCYRFAKIDKEHFGEIEDVTDKGYYTNSYHVDVREEIDAFSKLAFESEFQEISTGGCISYVEIPNMQHNLEALEEMVRFIYDNIQYAEFNTKSDYCHVCGFDGEIKINDDIKWECPNCGNTDTSKLTVVRRTCGYLGLHFWNEGKTREMKQRVLHL